VNIPFGHGVCREDIRIMTKDGILTIYGRKPVDKELNSNTLKELFAKYPQFTSFERNLQLPAYLDLTAIEPRWVHDGLLEIRIKKKEEKQFAENQVEIADMPTLTDPRYSTPMIKQDYKILASDEVEGKSGGINKRKREDEEEKEVKQEKKQETIPEEKVEEIDASKAKPPQTIHLPVSDKEKEKEKEKEKGKSPTAQWKPVEKEGKGKTTEKEKAAPKAKKKVSKNKQVKKGK